MWPALVGLLMLAVVAMACHESAVLHNKAIHSIDDLEEYCIDTSATTIDYSELSDFLADTLWSFDPDQDWDQVGGFNHVFWFPEYSYDNNCDAMPFNTWIQYTFTDATSGGLSVTRHDVIAQICEPDAEPEHCHYPRTLVTLNTSAADPDNTALARHVINHETGHVLGLLDPHIPGDPLTPCISCGIVSDDDDNYSTCMFLDPAGLRQWISSIMHSRYYCKLEVDSSGALLDVIDHVWPQQADRDKVVEIIEEFP